MYSYGIKELLYKESETHLQEVSVKERVRSFRSNRFIALNDGSTIKNIQIVIDFENFSQDLLKKIPTAASLKVKGEVVESQGSGQEIEIIAKDVVVLGEANPDEVQETIL